MYIYRVRHDNCSPLIDEVRRFTWQLLQWHSMPSNYLYREKELFLVSSKQAHETKGCYVGESEVCS
jgi:3'-phosphoadenosine 5'-phosphosulfate sulfotransferase (PAPS reductase)/FAD synthetase